MKKIAIIDYGMGNLHSAAKAVEKIGAAVNVTRDPDAVRKADQIILPGVGSFWRLHEKLACACAGAGDS